MNRPSSSTEAALSVPLQRAIGEGAPPPRLYSVLATLPLSVFAGPTAALVVAWFRLHGLRRLATDRGVLIFGVLVAAAQQVLVAWSVLDPESLRPLAERLAGGQLSVLLRRSQYLLGSMVWWSSIARIGRDLELADAAGLPLARPWKMIGVALVVALGVQASVGALAAWAR